MIRNFRLLAALALALGCACASRAAEEAAAPAEATAPAAAPLTAEEMAAAAKIDTLTIPSPGELLAAIDKLGKPDWNSAIRPPIQTNFSSREQMAINIGGLIADGYIAVEASSAQQVKNVGKDIRLVATGLGVAQEILNRGKSLTEFADEGKWDTLKEEFEATQNEVKTAMRDNKDTDLIVLVTLGGWIRGTQAMADYVSKHYTPEAAKLLRQPGIARLLNERIGALPEKVREDSSVRRARAGLGRMVEAVSFPLETAPTEEAMGGLKEMTTNLLKDLAKKK